MRLSTRRTRAGLALLLLAVRKVSVEENAAEEHSHEHDELRNGIVGQVGPPLLDEIVHVATFAPVPGWQGDYATLAAWVQ